MMLQNGNLENNLMNELEWGLRPEQPDYDINERERGLRMYRSGSAPPTIEGSYNAISNLFRNSDFLNGGMSEEEMRSHPAYLSYYYSHDNINPRLPPPLFSKEEWRMHQRLRSGGLPFGEMLNWRKRVVLDDEYESSLFSVQPTTSIQKENDGIMDPITMNMTNPSCHASSLWLDVRDHEFTRQGGTRIGGLGIRSKSFVDILPDGSNRPTALSSRIPRQASCNISYNLLDSCNPSFQPSELWNERKLKEDLHMGVTPTFNGSHNHHTMASPSFPTIIGSSFFRCSTTEFSRVSISPTPNLPSKERFLHAKQQQLLGKSIAPKLVDYPSSRKPSANLASKANSTRIRGFNEQNTYNNTVTHAVPNHALGGGQNGKCGNKMQLNNHYPETDSSNVQYYNHPSNQNLLLGRKYISASHGELSRPQKDQLDALIYGQHQSCSLPLPQKGHVIIDGYFDSLKYLLGMPYQGASMTNSLTAMQYTNSMLQSDVSTIMKGWIGMTILEEFKNKTRSFELPDIVGHVVEFSVDQCGSRFIQQKLEIATNEESMKVFPEIIPHARTLMTDVFGNYVIQKIFERGTMSQRNMLVGQIKGHVLQLSLQMYGCRVIQKALETLDVDEKTHMVAELDGLVLKCVRDQNGNHVIQKCVECVPEDKIQYIISSFFGQVAPLSTHPYGCRVIQRVLEHCNKENTKKRIMAEIMQSICTLAQDQYGNYVIQHVIQYGKPEEKSVIITKLEGQIMKMSQQKFASKVIEKCLTFGSPEERQAIVNEMLVFTDQSEPLQAMMKDPFGNYVVQKVLETCDKETRELILSRIKLHLNDLKKYTYVKHVVARVEKLLVTAGG